MLRPSHTRLGPPTCDCRGEEDGCQAVGVHVACTEQHVVGAADQERLLLHTGLLQDGDQALRNGMGELGEVPEQGRVTEMGERPRRTQNQLAGEEE